VKSDDEDITQNRSEDIFDTIDLDELFAGQAAEGGGMTLRLVRVDTESVSTALELGADEARVGFVSDDDADRIRLQATLVNRLGLPVSLDEIFLLVRSEDGVLVEYASHWIDAAFSNAQEIVHDFTLPPGVVDALATLEFWVDYEFEFRRVLAVARVELPIVEAGDPVHRIPLGIAMVTDDGPFAGPAYTLRMNAYCAVLWEPEVTVLLEVTEHEPTEGQARDLVVALRDEAGAILAKDTFSLARGGLSVPCLAKLSFPMSTEMLARMHRIDVAIAGTCERHESLGRFETLEPH